MVQSPMVEECNLEYDWIIIEPNFDKKNFGFGDGGEGTEWLIGT